MTRPERHHTSHVTEIDAPPDVVYRIIAEATDWPLHFTPSIHVERTAIDDTSERLRIWATAGGEVKTWTSRRDLDPRRHRIAFRQEVSTPPVAAMSGEWVLDPHADNRTRVTFHHHFDAVDDDPAGVEWINGVIDKNSTVELADIKALAENRDRQDELTLSFTDSVRIQAPSAAVYDFLYQAKKWPDRLGHVVEMDLREDVPGIQSMRMRTRARDGSVHTTESVRICFPEQGRIVYKQVVTPPLMTVHVGEWTIRETVDGLVVSSRHDVVLNEAAFGAVLGEGAGAGAARTTVRNALGGNSVMTLNLAKRFAEAHDA
ncbi:aromatase/cyclase [Actinoplanes sp. NPDC004185]